MIMKELFKKIQAIVRSAYADGKPERIAGEIKRLLRRFDARGFYDAAALRKLAESLEKAKWLDENTASPAFSKQANITIALGIDYAKTKAGIQDDVLKAVRLSLAENGGLSDIATRLKRIERIKKRNIETVARTAKLASNTVQSITAAVNAGVEYFRYEGPPPERDFCRRHYGKVYHISDIKKMVNDFGQSAWIYRGGWNCRHRWVAVPGYVPQAA
jgi:hypothetical protein